LNPSPNEFDRVLKALNHPVRRRILRELVDQPGSATTLSRAFRMDLGVVSYHLNQVLAKQCKVVELVDAVHKRGAVEKIYRLRVQAASRLPATVEPGSWQEVMWTMSLGESLLEAGQLTGGDE
jgi:DNA-binding transcriptional ArsR family regulator